MFTRKKKAGATCKIKASAFMYSVTVIIANTFISQLLSSNNVQYFHLHHFSLLLFYFWLGSVHHVMFFFPILQFHTLILRRGSICCLKSLVPPCCSILPFWYSACCRHVHFANHVHNRDRLEAVWSSPEETANLSSLFSRQQSLVRFTESIRVFYCHFQLDRAPCW